MVVTSSKVNFVVDYEEIIANLRLTVSEQDTELLRISTAISEKATILRGIIDKVQILDIDTSIKNMLIDSCLTLIDDETTQKGLNITITESDTKFLSKLQKIHPNLNQREIKISLLVKLNFDTKKIGESIGVSTRGMESIRYRMHKKLGLEKHQSIKMYFSDFVVDTL